MNKKRWCGAQLHSAVISIKHPTLRDLVGGQTAKLGNFDSCFSWAAEGSASAQIQKECCHPSRFARWHYRGLVPVTHRFSHITAITNTWCGVCRKRLCNYCQLGLLRTMWWVSSRRLATVMHCWSRGMQWGLATWLRWTTPGLWNSTWTMAPKMWSCGWDRKLSKSLAEMGAESLTVCCVTFRNRCFGNWKIAKCLRILMMSGETCECSDQVRALPAELLSSQPEYGLCTAWVTLALWNQRWNHKVKPKGVFASFFCQFWLWVLGERLQCRASPRWVSQATPNWGRYTSTWLCSSHLTENYVWNVPRRKTPLWNRTALVGTWKLRVECNIKVFSYAIWVVWADQSAILEMMRSGRISSWRQRGKLFRFHATSWHAWILFSGQNTFEFLKWVSLSLFVFAVPTQQQARIGNSRP